MPNRFSVILTVALFFILSSDTNAQTNLDSLKFQFDNYIESDHMDSALVIANQLKNVSFHEHGDSSIWYARSIYLLGSSYFYLQNIDSSQFYFHLAIKLFSERYSSHPDYGSSLNKLGIIYYSLGDFKSVEHYFLSALNIRKEILGSDNLEYARSLNNLGVLYSDLGDYSQAESYYLQSKEILRRILGENDPEYSAIINSLGALYSDKGDYSRAELYYQQSIEILKRIGNKYDPDYARALNNLGILYHELGDYSQAESCYLEVIDIWKQIVGKGDPNYAASINSLGTLYSDLGDYSRAESYYLESINICKQNEGENNPLLYVSGLNNLGTLYHKMGDYSRAVTYQLEAMHIWKRIVGEDDPKYARCINSLGTLYHDLGDYSQAEIYYLKALDIWKQMIGELNPEYAGSLHNLGELYADLGKYEQAESYYLKSMQIRKEILGEDHPDLTNSLINLTILNYNIHDYMNAVRYAKLFINNTWLYVDRNFPILSTTQKEKYLKKIGGYFDLFETISNKTKVKSMQIISFENMLRLKGLVLNSDLGTRDKITNIGSEENELLYSKWRTNKQYLVDQYSLPISERAQIIDSVEKVTEELEVQLSKISAELGLILKLPEMSYNEVQDVLKEGEAIVDFVHYYDQFDSLVRYDALILDVKSRYPKRVRLSNEEKLYAKLESDYIEQRGNKSKTYNRVNRGIIPQKKKQDDVYSLIWSPLDSLVREYVTIYYSPTGLLNEINLSALTTKDGKHLLDKYNLYRLTSTAKVIPGEYSASDRSATIFSGIDYDLTNTSIVESIDTTINISNDYWVSTTRAGVPSTSWKNLQFTKEEGDQINAMLINDGFSTQMYTGTSATEEKFKLLDQQYGPSPRIIHLATHGFFYPDAKKDINSINEPVYRISEDPMYRSGLIMAGANGAWTGEVEISEGQQDGILTAKEISTMDLSNTELVVLSACETGLGEVKNQEGVYGLQRAFKMAGVRYILMSLWQIPDKESKDLMVTFYKYWLEEDMSIPDAFNQAQKDMKEKYVDPYLWAGFVLME